MKLGKTKVYKDGSDIPLIYKQYSMNDEKSAKILMNSKLYNEASYLYIQSMEKYVKYAITSKINVKYSSNAKMVRDTGHSLDKSIELLLQVYSNNNDTLKQQIKTQLDTNVFKGVNLNAIQNNLRYPHYNPHKEVYSTMELSYKECSLIYEMLITLKKYIDDLISKSYKF
jgi:HEPN domain-containing protein